MIIEVDIKKIRFVVDILNESYRGEEGWTTEKNLVSGDRASDAMIRSEINNGYKYYLYQDENDYVGCFNLSQKNETIEIGALAIKAKYQGTGIGKFLLNQAEAISCSIPNITRLIVSVLEPRTELISFYERRGYRLTDGKYPFPTHRGVGEPLVDNLQVIILEKKPS